MFRKYAFLQWVVFWFVSSIVFFIEQRILPSEYNGISLEASILGNYFWAGATVVLIIWIITKIVKVINKKSSYEKENI
jgi:hypothetical protein